VWRLPNATTAIAAATDIIATLHWLIRSIIDDLDWQHPPRLTKQLLSFFSLDKAFHMAAQRLLGAAWGPREPLESL
jgi:hypothetical protein